MKEILSKYKDWQSIPVPEVMKDLPRDKRGYPIPVNVLWDNGQPVFAANNMDVEIKLIQQGRCSVSGATLNLDNVRLVTSPLNALSKNEIVALDSPVHVDALEYALKVCPYLALNQYYKGFKLGKEKRLAKKLKGKYEFSNLSPVQTVPPFMVCIQPEKIEIVSQGNSLLFIVSSKMLQNMTFYSLGEPISFAQAAKLLEEYMNVPEINDRVLESGLTKENIYSKLKYYEHHQLAHH